MPVLHQYEDGSGYYLRAKPSGLNTPITYQVHNSARSFFSDLGYRDGDSVPWEVIQPLRAIGHIYTNGQGVEEGDQTDSIGGKIAELNKKGRKELVDYIGQYTNISVDKKRELERLLEKEKVEEINAIIELLNGNSLSQSTSQTLPPSLRRIATEHFGSSSQQTVVASSRGKGNGYTDAFELKAAPVFVSAKHDGVEPLKLRFMASETEDSDELPRCAFYDSSPFDGTFIWEEAHDDEYILNVTADGEWNLLISQGVPEAEEIPLSMVGRDFEVFGPFTEDGFLSLEYEYYGGTWFELNTIDENGETESQLFKTDYLDDDIEEEVVSGSVAFSSNVPYVTIESYGEWQVNLTRA
jgi:hypothetical protein